MNIGPAKLPWLELLLVGVVVVVALTLWSTGQRKRQRRWSRAQAAEATAAKLLRRLGYEVLGAQVETSYTMVVDGQPVSVALRADYLVARGGAHYIAEVKSGKQAPKLGHPATRRQLLEYLVAFEVQGVLLVDGETEQVHEVEFPLQQSQLASSHAVGPFTIAVLAATVGAAWCWLMRH